MYGMPINKKEVVTLSKKVSGLYTLTVLRFNTVCCCLLLFLDSL